MKKEGLILLALVLVFGFVVLGCGSTSEIPIDRGGGGDDPTPPPPPLVISAGDITLTKTDAGDAVITITGNKIQIAASGGSVDGAYFQYAFPADLNAAYKTVELAFKVDTVTTLPAGKLIKITPKADPPYTDPVWPAGTADGVKYPVIGDTAGDTATVTLPIGLFTKDLVGFVHNKYGDDGTDSDAFDYVLEITSITFKP